ncbi:MAG: hypothetical protein JW982_04010 [Spirochaetes bacterium]|nr:hypothetical protein [Spirochaetota bacterium]
MKNDKYKMVVTEDGSSSLYSENFTELMHTRHGAFNESLEKHVIPSLILNKEKKQLNVLDIGFGMGYNILALLTEIKKNQCIHIDSFEFDRGYIEFLRNLQFNDEKDIYYSKIFSAFENGTYSDGIISISVHFGDARTSLLNLLNNGRLYDAVFQDPFSPSKNCELWTLDYFKLIYKLMCDDAVLTTYSNAFQVRRAMSEAGFYLARNVNSSFRKEGTLCFKKRGLLPEISDQELLEIINNYKSVPFRDDTLKADREYIAEERRKEIVRNKI